MKRATYTLFCIAMLTGCQNQKANMNPLVPYGATTVPVPATSSHSGAKQYYNQQPQAQQNPNPTVTTPTLRSDSLSNPAQARTSTSQTNATVSWQPVGTGVEKPANSSVKNVSYDQAVDSPSTANSDSSVLIKSTGTTLRLNGMPVNDATNLPLPGEPATFQPNGNLREISQLPQAAAQQATSGIVTATAKSSDNLQPIGSLSAQQTAAGTGGSKPQWRAPNGQ